MNRYEAVVTLTVSIEAVGEVQARRVLASTETVLRRRHIGLPAGAEIRHVESSDEIDCMEVATMRER